MCSRAAQPANHNLQINGMARAAQAERMERRVEKAAQEAEIALQKKAEQEKEASALQGEPKGSCVMRDNAMGRVYVAST